MNSTYDAVGIGLSFSSDAVGVLWHFRVCEKKVLGSRQLAFKCSGCLQLLSFRNAYRTTGSGSKTRSAQPRYIGIMYASSVYWRLAVLGCCSEVLLVLLLPAELNQTTGCIGVVVDHGVVDLYFASICHSISRLTCAERLLRGTGRLASGKDNSWCRATMLRKMWESTMKGVDD